MRVTISSTKTVTVNGPAILRVTSINDGDRSIAWPARLHPHEGTVSFLVNGERHRGSEQVDSMLDTVAVEPGAAVSTGVLLGTTDRGSVFATPGPRRIQVAVRPPGRDAEILSNTITVHVTEADPRDGASPLTAVDDAATVLRDGDTDDTAPLVAAMAGLGTAEIAWVATALLPAAPLPDDVLLRAARDRLAEEPLSLADPADVEVDDVSGEAFPVDREIASAILDGVAHRTNVD